MFVTVRFLNGFATPLTYAVPDALHSMCTVGSVVRVPLQRRSATAVVVAQHETIESKKFTIRPITRLEQWPSDAHFYRYCSIIAQYHALEPSELYERLAGCLREKETQLDLLAKPIADSSATHQLTTAQQKIVDTITHDFDARTGRPTLLHGVTGSGKTEVYCALIEEALTRNSTTLFLVPEVSLAAQFVQRIARTLGREDIVYGFHSGSTPGEKRTLWHALCSGKPVVIVGVHLPIFLPIANLGLIIVDEEHETGFQEKKFPRINSKEAALIRAREYKIPIILGSATPSLTSLNNVHERGWRLCTLSERFAGAFAKIVPVDLTQKDRRPLFWISHRLETELRACLAKKQQAILFLNRRGHSFFMQCGCCGFIPTCGSCSVSLTVHQDETLHCHYCGTIREIPAICPGCRTSADRFLRKGIGTQQLVEHVQKLLPSARVARADLDTTKLKRRWLETVGAFERGDIDILVGTQTITKGYHFPGVTLVGIIWADSQLNIPLYNATEVTMQRIIQVAGRAGRLHTESVVVVQYLTNGKLFEKCNEQKYTAWCTEEMAHRQQLKYPPFVRFALLEISGDNQLLVMKKAEQIASLLREHAQALKVECAILGPTQPPVYKIHNNYFMQIYLKAASYSTIARLYAQINQHLNGVSARLIQNPLG